MSNESHNRESPLAFLDLDLRSNTMDADVNTAFELLSYSNCGESRGARSSAESMLRAAEIQVSWDFTPDCFPPQVAEQPASEPVQPFTAEPASAGSEVVVGDVIEDSSTSAHTVERMLGIIQDTDDIAFDNATWYRALISLGCAESSASEKVSHKATRAMHSDVEKCPHSRL